MRLLFIFIALLLLQPADAQIIQFSGASTRISTSISNFGAACDGVTNDAAAFASFGDWAIANQGNSQVVLSLPAGATCIFEPNSVQAFWLYGPTTGITSAADNGSGKVRLTVNSTSRFASNWVVNVYGLTGTPLGNGSQTITVVDGTHFDLPNVAFVATGIQSGSGVRSQHGVKNLIVNGNGATIKNTLSAQPVHLGVQGLAQDSRHSARTASASAGATTITLNDPSLASLFVANTYAIMTGFDLQGIWQSPFGFPPNLHFFEYVFITNVNAGTGVITISAPLQNSYLSTWPNYNTGSFFEVDAGGPATLYYLDPAWDTTLVYNNLTFDQTFSSGSSGIGRSVTFSGVTFATGAGCVYPSQNYLWQALNVDGSICLVEVDKLIRQLVITNSTFSHLKFQSSSSDLLTMSGSTITTDMTGSPKAATISNTSFGTFQPGAYAYGVSTGAITCTNCTMNAVAIGGLLEQGSNGAIGVNNTMSMTSGVISYPNGTNITGAADNGSGKVRLTVDSTSGFSSNQQVNVAGIVGTTEANGGNVPITVVDATHFDLLTVNFVHAYVSGGVVGNYAPRWAVPGAYVMWAGGNNSETIFKITSVTQTLSGCAGSGCTNIQTSLAGGFPSVPLSSGKLFIRTHPAPAITCSGCSGSAEALDLAAAPAGLPMWSYAVRTYTGAIGTTVQPRFELWGNTGTISANVTNAYSGAGALSFHLSQFDNWSLLKSDNTTSPYALTLNAKTTGNRSITLSGVSGAQAGDSGLAVPDVVQSWFMGQSQSGSQYSADVSGSCPGAGCPSVTMTMQTSQGIILP